MNIEIRWIGKDYADVRVCVDGNRLEVGVLDRKEREELAQELQSAVDELLRE